ncbi:hypothetical protein HYPSUDRAFT_219122 [Hypholoma sublateritium FD-334 SS-4]|uniref:Uncharacterized protein n=1 Tax=Hypholoma sublateritium (strain FD-334 SS-4) TaxID=945553 RepID=A0A0D2ND51_HYPSF|nr:hypothetical protein HYPSUDRAFT_219122 [Hypholoma sublateritium FD-334 SS-4]
MHVSYALLRTALLRLQHPPIRDPRGLVARSLAYMYVPARVVSHGPRVRWVARKHPSPIPAYAMFSRVLLDRCYAAALPIVTDVAFLIGMHGAPIPTSPPVFAAHCALRLLYPGAASVAPATSFAPRSRVGVTPRIPPA